MKHIGLTEKCKIFLVMHNKLLVISRCLGSLSLSLFHNNFYALKISLALVVHQMFYVPGIFADFSLTMTRNL